MTISKLILRPLLMSIIVALSTLGANASTPAQSAALAAFLNRIGGEGAANRFVTDVDPTLASNGKERFVISAVNGKPAIKGSTTSAVTTGINWYLNHYANINLAWNRPNADLVSATLPLPTGEESHTCVADYRYYLNYCTFSYSMSTWTWERWQQEIDWMALHGINMPLQIIGLDVVWRNTLVNHFGYTPQQANAFIAGPCFQAWWGMNNLEGWGGPNPDWWYTRQADLATKILARERELGIEPVLPGYAGMIPSDFQTKTGIKVQTQGEWCAFTRPYIVDPNSDGFNRIAEKYYAELNALMGTSKYYSIDPFHEGANTSGIDVPAAYRSIRNAMVAAQPDSKWVIQSWQWSGAQYNVLEQVEKGRLIVLDLFSDGRYGIDNYRGHETVYCSLPNFGGRTGLFGRLDKVADTYFTARNSGANLKGIGATPEAIEQVSVNYDLLFELPWMQSKPDMKRWVADYARARYGKESTEAANAWELLHTSALNCQDGLQGPHEAVMCARPAFNVNSVSTWGGSNIFYDQNQVIEAAYSLLGANLDGNNYLYDLTDVTRQALSDYSKALLRAVANASSNRQSTEFKNTSQAFLNLILDTDRLLNTHPSFMLGNWTEMARDIAAEAAGTTAADANWLEYNNARTIITTWGDRRNSENGGLKDYSYRQKGGMLKDFYYQRWKRFFDNTSTDWFAWEWDWAHNNATRYPTAAIGSTRDVANEVLNKYLSRFVSSNPAAAPCYVYHYMPNDYTTTMSDYACCGTTYTPNINASVAEIAIDLDNDGVFANSERQSGASRAIDANAPTGAHKARLTLTDGTTVAYTLYITEEITEPRRVAVASQDPKMGSVAIEGTTDMEVTTKLPVTMKATAAPAYEFDRWVDNEGRNMGNLNPITYYGKAPITFTATFVQNKWSLPAFNGSSSDWDMIVNGNGETGNKPQRLTMASVTQNGVTSKVLDGTEPPASHFITIPVRVKAAPGGKFAFNWEGASSALQYMFLTAYADLNCDGKFAGTAPELLATRGSRNSANASVANGTVNVLLPFDLPLGTTHLRFRFDSAWGSNYDNSIGAFPADAATNRLIYELILEVAQSPAHDCRVTVKSQNNQLGSVSIDGSVYKPGEKVVIFSYPTPGYHIDYWMDANGRKLPAEWMSGNSLTFTVYDNADITAVFAAGDAGVTNATADQGVSARAEGDSIIVAGLKPSDKVTVYGTKGEIIHRARSKQTTLTIPAPVPGLYIVNTPNSTQKVIIGH